MPFKILVIEDDLFTRENHVDMLEEEGFDTASASNGQDGLDRAVAGLPDLILCDIGLPGLSGLDLVKRLRSEPRTAEIPVVIVTARSSQVDRQAGMALGATDFLIKPCMVDDVLRVIFTRLKMGHSPQNEEPVSPAVSALVEIESFTGHPKLGSAFRFILENFRGAVSLADVARHSGYSPAYLTDSARRLSGRTIQRWVIDLRLAEAAIQLTESDLPIEQIATAIGFCDASHLTRMFRRQTGITPQIWRLAHRDVSRKRQQAANKS